MTMSFTTHWVMCFLIGCGGECCLVGSLGCDDVYTMLLSIVIIVVVIVGRGGDVAGTSVKVVT